MQSVSAIAYHGWGFDHHIWSDWQAQFAAKGWQFTAGDRGYFGAATIPDWQTQNSFNVVLAHSLGLQFCSRAVLEQTDLLVLFNCFLSFHPLQGVARRRSQRILQQMMAKFQTQPEMVLADFHQNCYFPAQGLPSLPEKLNRAQLLADLNLLDTAQSEAQSESFSMVPFSMVSLSMVPHILGFNGGQDRIVSSDSWIQRVESVTFENAGHALPFTQFPECWTIVQNAIQSCLVP